MKYTLPNQDKSLFVTFESGYENVKIYFDGALLGRVERSEDFVNGVVFSDSPVGVIDLRFPTGRRALEIRVDDVLCTPEVSAQDVEELRSFDKIFWALTILAIAGTLIQAYMLRLFLSVPAVQLELAISIVAILSYLTAAILIRQGKAWAYLLGTVIFTLMTLYYILAVHLTGWGFIGIIVTIVRLVIMALLFYKMTSVFTHFKKNTDLHSKHTLLDDF